MAFVLVFFNYDGRLTIREFVYSIDYVAKYFTSKLKCQFYV